MEQNSWKADIRPSRTDITAYPSFAFRLRCIKSILTTQAFETDLTKKFSALGPEKDDLKKISDFLKNVPDDDTVDHPVTRPTDDPDAKAIQQAFVANFDAIKSSLRNLFTRVFTDIGSALQGQSHFDPVSGDNVFELIQRLDADILPNIIPQQGSLLGNPATFSTILNSCALFRMHILSNRGANIGHSEIYHQVHKVERLAAKAFEVSYIQNEFNEWSKKKP